MSRACRGIVRTQQSLPDADRKQSTVSIGGFEVRRTNFFNFFRVALASCLELPFRPLAALQFFRENFAPPCFGAFLPPLALLMVRRCLCSGTFQHCFPKPCAAQAATPPRSCELLRRFLRPTPPFHPLFQLPAPRFAVRRNSVFPLQTVHPHPRGSVLWGRQIPGKAAPRIDVLSPVAPAQDVTNRAGKFIPQATWHAKLLRKSPLRVNR